MNSDPDPLSVRLELLSHLLKEYNIPKENAEMVEIDLQILNTFALAKDWTKVKLALDRWTDKLKDATQIQIIICKWNVSMEIAIDGSDIQFLQLLIPFVGKHKKLRIRLSLMAIALEKQDHKIVELMIKCLNLDTDENSILARLPKDDKKAFQVLFNRYCLVSDDDIIKELLKEFKNSEVSNAEAAEIAKEHRLAMLTYLCHNSKIIIAEDTIWNCINSGNVYISKFLETLKDISVIGWMETIDPISENSPKMETGERPNTPLYHRLKNTPSADDEQFSSMLALYAAYGGNLTAIDTEISTSLLTIKGPDSPRSYTGFLSRKGAPKRFRTSSAIPSQAAVKIVQSKQNDYWTNYLSGETADIVSLPWMEPSNDVKSKSIWNQSYENIAEDPLNAIFEGFAGVASRTNSNIMCVPHQKSRSSLPIVNSKDSLMKL